MSIFNTNRIRFSELYNDFGILCNMNPSRIIYKPKVLGPSNLNFNFVSSKDKILYVKNRILYVIEQLEIFGRVIKMELINGN